ncbi:MAG: TonB-dependent receptor family protein [Bacteroidia bacterium]|nr:TonB-dependent receptor family protein [Bacteroidia bacterium]NNF31721.1 TonB-dependent receptor [Flavobacteriaceae bacterium]NNJ81118.1 TonB-dependent receptor [Flavobacteriaceae bacterium]NNK55235.1 TonB-dependent receptor [Flavobacteriaceae bacterium]NNM10230.1 TonB-dependent receptor [Flavobacteriaceae bacterium]
MKKTSFFTVVLCLVNSVIFSQTTHTISGQISDTNDQGIPFANVLLMKASDSTLVKGSLTNEDGAYSINEIPTGTYYVQGTYLGFQSSRTDNFELRSHLELPVIILTEGEALGEVVVQARKPLYTQKVDRLVINVENSIVSSGGTALEVLERSPGVVINRQSNDISVVGKEGVVVMINGKISYVPTSSLVQLLDGMSADNIESIELITTPPANFDAEGNAGFINIVMKKNSDLGLNGSYSLSAGYGKGATSNDNINFNYRKNDFNLFGSYSFLLDKRDQIIKTSREFRQDGDLISNASVTDREPTQRNHNVRLGADYQVSDKTILGVILTGFDNKWTMDALNNSMDAVNGMPVGFVELANTERNQLKHFGGNFNIKHDFTENQFISMDVDYLFYEFDNPTDYTNRFFDGSNTFLRTELLESRKETPLTTLVGKLDYSNRPTDKFKFELGVKGIKNDFENDVSVANQIDGVFVFDPSLTNFSVLDESILAGYVSGEYTIDEKTNVKAGVRYEYTDSKLDTDTEGTVVDRQYGIWFPSVFLSRQWTEDLSMNLSYSKRITRPTFNDLAPFVIFFEPNTFISGNASLQPAISNAYKYDINFKNYFLSFSYTDQDSSIANFQERIDPETGRLIFEAANLDYTRTFSIIAGIPVKISDWWRTQNNLTFVNQQVRSFYLEEPVEQELGIFSVNSTHSFKISDSFSAELSGFYNGPGFFGNARYDEVYGINLGLQKKFSDKWGTLKFSINDILDSVEFNGGTDLPEQNILTRNTFDFNNRTFTLTYSRNFGNKELRSARNRETGSEEERRRIN